LLILLGLSVLLYLGLKVDWSTPGRYYRNYQQLNALVHRKDQLDTAVARLQKRYGPGAGMSYSVNTNFQGTFTQTLQATRACGPLDDRTFLEDAKQFFREAGLGKADRVEYLYGCDAPLTFGMTVEAFDRALDSALKEHSWCRQITTSSDLDTPNSASQIWADNAAGVLVRLSLDEEGLINKGQWLDASIPLVEKEAQFRLMVCMTRGAMRVLEPSLSNEQIKTLMSGIWFNHTQRASVTVGRYTFDSEMKPFGFTVTRVRKD
jgi:hypothetical protein